MHTEIEQAVTFLGRLLYPKMDEALINAFQAQLMILLKQRYANHWDPQQPYRGNAFRAITHFDGQLDPVLIMAAEKATVSPLQVTAILPRDFVMWIDPFSVSYRVGDHGNIMTLFDDRTLGAASAKSDPSKASHSPRLAYIQQSRVSTPIRISPPSSPDNKKLLTKAHLHQSSPLAIAAKEQATNDQPVPQAAEAKPQPQPQGAQQLVMAN